MSRLKVLVSTVAACAVAVGAIFAPYQVRAVESGDIADAYANIVWSEIADTYLAYYNSGGANNPEGLAILAAQGALAYAYAHNADTSTITSSGNSQYIAGYTFFGGVGCFGSGYANDTATQLRITASGDGQSFVGTMSYIGSQQYLGSLRTGTRQGLTTIGFGSSMSTAGNFDSKWNGDPCTLCGWRSVANPSEALSGLASSGGNLYGRLAVYNGGITDIDTLVKSAGISGNFADDLGKLQESLQETYPDFTPEAYPDFYPSPTVEPTEETTEEPTEETTEDPTTDGMEIFTLPPSWLQDYPVEIETLPLPTIEATEPELDLTEYAQGLEFWIYALGRVVESMHLQSFIIVVIILFVVFWVLWKTGGDE